MIEFVDGRLRDIRFGMSLLGQKIREIRLALGMNQAQFADEVGTSQGTVSKWERGDQAPDTDAFFALARVGGLGAQELRSLAQNVGLKAQSVASARTPLSGNVIRGGARDLPVHGIAMGGAEDEGDFRLNGEIQYFLDRPAGLKGRKRAFAAVLRNDSMIDSYKPGWPIFVDPDGKQPVPGADDVFVELYPMEDGQPGPAFVKKLLARRGGDLVLWQQNPAREICFSMDRVKQILRVIPYPEAMGLSV